MQAVIYMYITLMPVILSGIFTMVWCKSPILRKLQIPIDGGNHYRDGKRIFGENKTWKGLVGYLLINAVVFTLWGQVSSHVRYLQLHNYFYINYENTVSYNLLIGVLLGLGYALFELPNSFMKRRLDIRPGKTIAGNRRLLFVFIDQVDSILGCALVVWLFYDIGILIYIGFVLIGALTHIGVNMVLYAMHLRKNMF